MEKEIYVRKRKSGPHKACWNEIEEDTSKMELSLKDVGDRARCCCRQLVDLGLPG